MPSTAVQDRAVTWRQRVTDAVHKGAPAHGADPDLLLDSLKFIDTLDDLVDVKTTSDWFPAAIDKKIEVFMAGPTSGRYRARPAVDPWPILRKIDEYVPVAGIVKDVKPIRDLLAPLRNELR